jgi:hypothetical protein
VGDFIEIRANLWCISKIKREDTLRNKLTEKYETGWGEALEGVI